MRKSFKNMTLAVVALGAFSLTACMSSGSSVAVKDDENATVFVSAKMKNVNTLSKPGLGKLTPITLTTLRITAVSDKVGAKTLNEDSVVVTYSVGDTLQKEVGDTVVFSSSATADIEFSRELSLRPLRSWTLKVETLDDQGDVIQSGTANLGQLFAGQVKGVSVNAGALYDNYKAKFNFDDSITSATGTISRQDMKVTKVSMRIGSDSVFAPLGGDTAFVVTYDTTDFNPPMVIDTTIDTILLVAPNINHFLNIYKVDTAKAGPASTDSVYLNIYGYLPQGTANGGSVTAPILLYTKTQALKSLNKVSTNTVTLNWVGPTTGVADMTIEISKVGTIDIDVVTPPDVID